MRHHHQISSQTFKIITQYGDMLVVKQGVHQHHHQQHQQQQHGGANTGASSSQQQQQQQQSTARPIIMTFHDLGLNSELQFATFCECDEVKLMLQTFTIIHVNFIGQEFDLSGQPADSLPHDFKYPTVEQMAECVVDICAQLRVRSFIALAVGAGAHIVSSLALLRPDLVHGLFLINPVLSSCSITEWLCFKMSAIASNHQLASLGHSQGGGSRAANDSSSSSSVALADSPTRSSSGNSAGDSRAHHQQAASGLRKLWNAVHHQHHSQQSQQSSSNHSSVSSRHASSSQLDADGGSPTSARLEPPHTQSGEPADLQQSARPPPGHRLRQLILSRNFRLGKHQHQHQNQQLLHQNQQNQRQPAGGEASESSLSSSPSRNSERCSSSLSSGAPAPPKPASGAQNDRRQSITTSIGAQLDVAHKRPDRSPSSLHSSTSRRRFSGGSASLSAANQAPQSPTGRANKRPPIEYLMYHHFGSASFQRIRRPSSGSETSAGGGGGGESANDRQQDSSEKQSQQRQHRSSCSSTGSGQSQQAAATLAAASVAANMLLRQTHRNSHESNSATGDGQPDRKFAADSPKRGRGGRAHRSHSVSLSAQHLASFASDRQRAHHMQMVYKQYFTQVNAHNLWLFAQSFIKRHTLNLRKDCGAAAHAAATAAALGTSICAAFVGIAPAPESSADLTEAAACSGANHAAASVVSAAPLPSPARASVENKRPLQRTTSAKTTQQQQQQQRQQQRQSQQAVVAGTKVKRTFTCQTLIMCSSVHIHCERALKLMTLLNPLQATWIKTDQMLVLEERPEKVCQALRLFLQGIGYFMSTYERRLRLNSAQASFSSADSNSSARSQCEPAPPASL